MGEHAHDPLTLGELGRMIERLVVRMEQIHLEATNGRHHFRNEVAEMVGRIQTEVARNTGNIVSLGVRMDNVEKDVRDLTDGVEAIEDKVNDVRRQAAYMSGGVGVVAFMAQLFRWPWER